MWFRLSGLKEIKWESKKISLLIESSNSEEIRSDLQKTWIVILSISQYNEELEKFWIIEFKFQLLNKQIRAVTEMDKVKESYLFLINDLSLKVTYINSLKNPLSQDKIDIVMAKLIKEYWPFDWPIGERSWSWKAHLKIDDKKITEFRNLINSTLNEAIELMKLVEWVVSPQIIRQLKWFVDELTKLKMWQNIEKLVTVFENVVRFMENVELAYVDAMKSQEKLTLKDSMILDLDIVAEYEKYRKALKITELSKVWKASKSSDDYYYWIFKKFGIYMKMLARESYYKLSEIDFVFYHTFEYLEYFMIFMLVEVVLFLMISGNSWYYSVLWNIWLFWLLIFFFKFLKFKDLHFWIAIFIFFLILFFVLRYFIIMYFSL